MTSSLIHQPALHAYKLDNADIINRALIHGFEQHIHDADIKKSHFFNNRYENIYIDSSKIPEITTILNTAVKLAAEILCMPATQLKAGLWFNAMGKGDITLPHRHDDDDELLSAVYYVRIPDNSGKLILSHRNFRTQVEPEAGLFVFFPADMLHEVTANQNNEMRLSLGINIGPA